MEVRKILDDTIFCEIEESQTDDKLNESVEILDLSLRASNCLRRADIKTLGELLNRTESQLLSIRNLGKKSFKEIMDKLGDIGYHLKGE